MLTKYGNCEVNNNGYYVVKTRNEYRDKLLHRVIWEDHYREKPDGVIHHKDGDKLNNDIDNLELMSRNEHTSLHHKGKEGMKGANHPFYGRHHSEETKKKISVAHKGKKQSDETKRKMSEAQKGEKNHMYGKHHSDEGKIKMSKAHNNITGYYAVTKVKSSTCKQGFTYRYQYYVDGKRKHIDSVDINKLEKKVVERGLKWINYNN